MKIQTIVGLGLLATALSVNAADDLAVTFGYDFGGTDSQNGLALGGFGPNSGWSASPDAGYVIVDNLGSSPFSGTLSLLAVPNFDVDFSHSWSGVILPGGSVRFEVGYESSNTGGFGGPFGSPETGPGFTVTGLLGASPVSDTRFDVDVHSGVFRTNPFGEVLDNFILQGGSGFGFDTGDDFEVTQATATYHLTGDHPVPEVQTYATAFGAALIGLRAIRRRRTA